MPTIQGKDVQYIAHSPLPDAETGLHYFYVTVDGVYAQFEAPPPITAAADLLVYLNTLTLQEIEDTVALRADTLGQADFFPIPDVWERAALQEQDIPRWMRAFVRVYAKRKGVAVSTIVGEVKNELDLMAKGL